MLDASGYHTEVSIFSVRWRTMRKMHILPARQNTYISILRRFHWITIPAGMEVGRQSLKRALRWNSRGWGGHLHGRESIYCNVKSSITGRRLTSGCIRMKCRCFMKTMISSVMKSNRILVHYLTWQLIMVSMLERNKRWLVEEISQ